MKNIIFSVPLLQALGCNMKNIAMDFLKYKHVFLKYLQQKTTDTLLMVVYKILQKYKLN